MVHTEGCCLNIDFVYVAVDGIVFEMDGGLRVLIPRKVDEPLHGNDYTRGKIWVWVPDTFINRMKDECKIARIQKRIMEMIVGIKARISAEDRKLPFILLWNKHLQSRGSLSRMSRHIQVHTGRRVASSGWNGTAGSC